MLGCVKVKPSRPRRFELVFIAFKGVNTETTRYKVVGRIYGLVGQPN